MAYDEEPNEQNVNNHVETVVMRCYPLDEKGIQIKPLDVLKVFHFTGQRGKKHYMYKQVKKVDGAFLVVSHLTAEGDYRLAMNGRKIKGYEVVQGVSLDDRKPIAA
jgi:hypothetical protein